MMQMPGSKTKPDESVLVTEDYNDVDDTDGHSERKK